MPDSKIAPETITTEDGDELLVCGCGRATPVLVDGRCGPCNDRDDGGPCKAVGRSEDPWFSMLDGRCELCGWPQEDHDAA